MSVQNDPCTDPIVSDLLFNCDNPPVAGLQPEIVLINVDQLDSFTKDGALPDSLLTNITLNAAQTGYRIEGVKSVFNHSNTIDIPEDSLNGVLHSLSVRVYNKTAEGRDQVNKLIQGSKVYAVVKRKDGGNDANDAAFLVFGIDHGLVVSDMTDDANENQGTILLTLSTPPNVRETYLPHVLLITDFDTTNTAFENKFAA